MAIPRRRGRWIIVLTLVAITLLLLAMPSPLVLGGSLFSRAASTTRKRMHSPACFPHLPKTTKTRIKRIYFAHMRKAGGTTIMAYLQKVAKFHKLQFIRSEAGPGELPGSRDDTLYVTHLRDPVERSLSHFKFEGRWSCSLLQNWKKQKTSKTKAATRPTSKNAHSLEAWIATEFQRNDAWTGGHPTTGPKCTSRMWMCSTNCYVKWMNYEKGHCVRDLEHPDYYVDTTLDRLQDYHLIIDVQRLFQGGDYVERLETFFGVPGLLGSRVNVPCDKPSKEANQEFPLNVTDRLLDELRQRNRLDYIVYNQTMNCKETTFPYRVLADYVTK